MESQVNQKLIDSLIKTLDSKLNIQEPQNNLFHLVWVKGDSLPFLGELCIKSIRNHNYNSKIILHYTNEALSNCERIKKLIVEEDLILNKINDITSIENVEINRVTAQSDIIRLLVIHLYGGIYVDTDMIILKNLDELFEKLNYSDKDMLLGYELHKSYKLKINNGMILGKKDNFIGKLWLSNISKFYNPEGWSEHGVELITKIYQSFPKKIFLYEASYFHPFPHWEIEKQLNKTKSKFIKNPYLVHCFNSSCKNIFKVLESEDYDYLKRGNVLSQILTKGLYQNNIYQKLQKNIKGFSKEYDPYNSVHLIFKEKSFKNIEKYCIQSLRYHNPELVIIIHVDENVFDFSQENYCNILIEKYNFKDFSKEDIKFYIAYLYGGMICDFDLICLQSLKPCFDTLKEYGKIIVCKELSKEKDFYVNDGVIFTLPKNPIFREFLNSSTDNYVKKLSYIYSKNKDAFILCSNLNFNPINYYNIYELFNKECSKSEIIDYLKSSFMVNLFAKTTKSLFDSIDLSKNTLLSAIINIGLGNEKFYNSPIIEQKINYINLKKRPERNLFFIATWSRIFNDLQRFDAILTRGKINGCGKSHQTIVQNSPEDYVIVLEDDAIPKNNFMEKIIPILDYAKENTKDFELITLASPTLVNIKDKSCYAKSIKDISGNIFESLIKIDNCSSSHFIIYSKSILPFFDKFYTDLYNNKSKETNQDWYFNLQPDLRKLISKEFLSLQYFGFFSDVVSANRENNFFENGENQLKIILSHLDNGLNLYKFIDKKYISF